jgi:hypothetical protein
MPGDYNLEEISSTEFKIVHKEGKEQYTIKVNDMGPGNVVYEGMPEQFKIFLNSYSDQDLRSMPKQVLETILRS